MKKFLSFLGTIFVIALIVGLAALGRLHMKGTALDNESKLYADTAIPAIVRSWNQAELEKRASPEFRKATPRADLARLFIQYRRLGAMRSYAGSEGQCHIMFFTDRDKQITAEYIARAQFAAGPAAIKIKLIKHGADWQIYGFFVDSKVFGP